MRSKCGGRWQPTHGGRRGRRWSPIRRRGQRHELEGVATPSTGDGGEVHWLRRRRRWMGWRSTVSREAGTSKAERRARGRSSMGGGRERGENPPPPQHWIRPPRHGQRRRPAVTGACALSAVSVVTARCWVGGEQHGRGHRRTRLETGMGR
jgi:hypothetical protein